MAHIVKNAKTERLIGYSLVIAGLYLVYDAYEKRGQRRPFFARLLPG